MRERIVVTDSLEKANRSIGATLPSGDISEVVDARCLRVRIAGRFECGKRFRRYIHEHRHLITVCVYEVADAESGIVDPENLGRSIGAFSAFTIAENRPQPIDLNEGPDAGQLWRIVDPPGNDRLTGRAYDVRCYRALRTLVGFVLELTIGRLRGIALIGIVRAAVAGGIDDVARVVDAVDRVDFAARNVDGLVRVRGRAP